MVLQQSVVDYGDYFALQPNQITSFLIYVGGESAPKWSTFIAAMDETGLRSTTLILNSISSVPFGTTVTVKGKLIDSATGTGLIGKISFHGTGTD